MSNLSDLPDAKWAPKPTLRFKTQLQAETALASTEESLRTQKAIADHLCVECAELRKDKARLDTLDLGDLSAILIHFDSVPCYYEIHGKGGVKGKGKRIREAIDSIKAATQ